MSTNTTFSVSHSRANSIVERTSQELQEKLYESFEELTFGEVMGLLKSIHPITSILMMMNIRCSFLDTEDRDELINYERETLKVILDKYVSEEITYNTLIEVRDLMWKKNMESMKRDKVENLIPYGKGSSKNMKTDKMERYAV